MAPTGGISFCGLIAILILIVLLIKLAVKGGKTGRIIAAVLGVLLLLVPVWMFLSFHPVVPVARVSTGDLDWSNISDLTLEPDVYPSVHTAATALVSRLVRSEEMDKWAPPPIIQLTGELDNRTYAQVASALRDKFPTLTVNLPDAPTTSPAADGASVIKMQLRIDGGGSGSVNGYQYTSQTLRLDMIRPTKTIGVSANVVRKPWVDDFAEFVNTNSGKQWISACSPRPCVSPFEAQREALAQGAARLTPRIIGQVRKYPQGWRFGWSRREVETSEVSSFIQTELANGQLVSDRFIQQFHRPYGNVWREYVLIDASPENIQMLAQRYRTAWTGERAAWLRTIGSCAALMGLIYIIYLFLNAATRGYYTWSLRVAAVVLGGIVAIMLIRLA